MRPRQNSISTTSFMIGSRPARAKQCNMSLIVWGDRMDNDCVRLAVLNSKSGQHRSFGLELATTLRRDRQHGVHGVAVHTGAMAMVGRQNGGCSAH